MPMGWKIITTSSAHIGVVNYGLVAEFVVLRGRWLVSEVSQFLKILCVCNGGNVRSVALAEALKGTYGCEAISASTYWLSKETMRMLCEWADVIAPIQIRDPDYEPEPDRSLWRENVMWTYGNKVHIFPIGKDVYGNAQHAELRKLIKEVMKTWLLLVTHP